MHSLTNKQQDVFDFILAYYREHHSIPNYPTIQEEFDLSSSNSVYQYLEALKKKGYLEKTEWGYTLHESKRALARRNEKMGIPIRGEITAGGMQEAIESDMGHLPVELVLQRSPDLFALKVVGNSMVDADIRDGDYIILEQKKPESGEIGAILYQGETTLKRIMDIPGQKGIVLQAENPGYDPIHISPDEWEEVRAIGNMFGKAWTDGSGWHIMFRTR
jgi:repressor LexA